MDSSIYLILFIESATVYIDMEKQMKVIHKNSGGGGGAVYGLGVIGALVYFLQHATNFTDGLLGILKAIVWPAFFVYHIFDFLKM